MVTALDEIRADLAAFADDDEDVILDANGQCLLVRHGEDISFSLVTSEDNRLMVLIDGEHLPYRAFLTHRLAHLDVLAERILQKRPPLPTYVDGSAELKTPDLEPQSGRALALLAAECSSQPAFAARVLFVTADAGQGKTALLRQFQHDQAKRFVRSESGYVFWHVDLQGRQLLRLSEALMGDLGEMRVAGLWMPAVIRLLRQKSLVLAIDGFDELAAEQGGGDALGALALLVQQIGASGTIVAASRRTFFDTDDYISRSRMFARTGGGDCQFDQLSLAEWGSDEGTQYLSFIAEDGARFPDPVGTYGEIVDELGAPDHTMVTRPFLLAQIARALLRFSLSPADFIRGMDDPYKGVAAVIEAFVDREVRDKWKQKDTGEPYLTKEQHLELLADIAEEMLRAQRTTLSVDVIETIASLLFDKWHIEQTRRQQILEMVRMHVLLTPPADEDYRSRRFDHDEFLAWFSAYALKDRLEGLGRAGAAPDLLSIAQVSDATASYVCALIERTPDRVAAILAGLEAMVERDWKPTFLQQNVGTLVPYLVSGIEPEGRFEFAGRVVYSSVVFEKSKLHRVTLRNGSFVQAGFSDVDWDDVVLDRCILTEPSFNRAATYRDVVLLDCTVDGVRLIDADDEEIREYAPDRVQTLLAQIGVRVEAHDAEHVGEAPTKSPDGDTRRIVRRVLSLFRRTTFISDATVAQRLPRDARQVKDVVLPLMVEFGIVTPKAWRGSGRKDAWTMSASLAQVEKGDGDSEHDFYEFWRRVDALDKS
jgi:hypothetical protein